MNDEELNVLIKKVNFFKDKSKPVHVSIKSGKFYNGFITEINADFFIVSEFKFGEQPVFYVEVLTVEEYWLSGEEGG